MTVKPEPPIIISPRHADIAKRLLSGKRPGRPPTTHSRSTPIVSFRLGAVMYRALEGFAQRKGISASQAAKSILEIYLAM